MRQGGGKSEYSSQGEQRTSVIRQQSQATTLRQRHRSDDAVRPDGIEKQLAPIHVASGRHADAVSAYQGRDAFDPRGNSAHIRLKVVSGGAWVSFSRNRSFSKAL